MPKQHPSHAVTVGDKVIVTSSAVPAQRGKQGIVISISTHRGFRCLEVQWTNPELRGNLNRYISEVKGARWTVLERPRKG